MASSESVRVVRESPIRRVHLDNGPRNPLDLAAVRDLRAALAGEDPDPVVLLEGRSDGFSVGLDEAVLGADAASRETLLAEMGGLLVDVLRSPSRLVVLCRGHAVAAGAMLLLVADVRLGVSGSHRLGFTEPGRGLPLPELPALLARERLARAHLHRLTVLGETVTPRDAVEVGLLDEVVPAHALVARGLERARALSSISPEAYLGTQRALRGSTLERVEALVAEQVERARRAREV